MAERWPSKRRGPRAWKMLLNRVNRLRKFVEMEPIAPREIILKEIELIEQAREKWRDDNAYLIQACREAELLVTERPIGSVLRSLIYQGAEFDATVEYDE